MFNQRTNNHLRELRKSGKPKDLKTTTSSIRNLRKREQHALLRLPRDLGLPDVVQDDPPALAAEAVALDALLEQLHLEQQLRRLLVADAVFQEYRASEGVLCVENKSREYP